MPKRCRHSGKHFRSVFSTVFIIIVRFHATGSQLCFSYLFLNFMAARVFFKRFLFASATSASLDAVRCVHVPFFDTYRAIFQLLHWRFSFFRGPLIVLFLGETSFLSDNITYVSILYLLVIRKEEAVPSGIESGCTEKVLSCSGKLKE